MLPTSLSEWLRSLRQQRARTITTLGGIAWGTFSVVGLLSFGAGFQALMAERAQGLGSGIVIAWPDRTSLSWKGFPEGRAIRLRVEDIEALARDIPEIEAVSPEFFRREQVRRGERVFRTQINGVDPDYGTLRNQRPQPGGRYLNREDLEAARRVMFLGDRIAEQLFDRSDPVGRTLVLGGSPFTVVGVQQPKKQDSDYGGLDDTRVCIPYTTHAQVFGDRYINDFVFRARDPERTVEVIDRVHAVLARRIEFDPQDREALSVWDTTENARMRKFIFFAMHLLMGGGGACTLLVGAIGVGNLMFLLVRQRTREIGVMMALGARPRWILSEVMVQTLLLVAFGGALGFAAAEALAIGIGISPLADTLGTPRISPALALGTIAVLAVVGLAAGLFPARRAARLDPVRALAD